jgi:hypothetical protein
MGKGLSVFIKLAIILSALSILVYAVFYFIGIHFYPDCFPMIPAYYLIVGVILSSLVAEYSKKEEGPPMRRLMLLRLVKTVGSLLVLVAGILLDKVHVLPYIITFVLFYLVYLWFETKVMLSLNKKKIE